jgi:hypothetical protein
MSYEDLEAARANRVAKEQAAASKSSRGRKPRNSAPEVNADLSESESMLVRRIKEPEAVEVQIAPWGAPVARMY